MRTYAILGGTGQTGSEIVRTLLLLPPDSTHLNIYARSSQRLETKFPGISNRLNVTLFIGDLSDNQLLSKCLKNADIVLSAVAQNRNEPGCSIAQRTALAIIKALEPRRSAPVATHRHRQKGDAGSHDKCPVVFLSSGGVAPGNTSRDTFSGRFMYNWVLYHVYSDLEKSLVLLQQNPRIPLVIAAAGALVHDEPRGVELTTDVMEASKLVSYADLAQGMILMGEQGEKWEGKTVGIIANGGKPIGGNPLALLRYLLPIVLAMVCPPLWWLGKDWWPA
jgi:hypothetical protein